MSAFKFETDPATAEHFRRAAEREYQSSDGPTSSTGSTAGSNGGTPHADGTKGKGPPRLPDYVPGDWMADHNPVLPDELIHNLLHKGAKMVLGGGSKSFKTWALADLAISISAGCPWWGMETVKGVVVYLNFEIQSGFFHFRLKEIATAKGVSLSENLLVWNLRGYAEPAKMLLPEVAERLKGLNVVAIIIDPVYKLALGTDENAAGETAKLLNEFEKLAETTGAAVIFGAHFSKGNQAGKETMDRISGSGVYARDPDAILTMTRHVEDMAFTVDATLHNCPPLPPFAVKWEFPLMVPAPDLDPAQLKEAKAPNAKRTFTAEDIVGVMPMGESLKAGQWQKLASDECGVGRSRFYELKAQIEKDGHPKISRRDGTYTRIA